MQNSIRKIARTVLLAALPISLLSGCVSPVPYDASLTGTTYLGIVTSVNNPKVVKSTAVEFKKMSGQDIPKGQDLIKVLRHYGTVDGWRWVGSFAQPGMFEVGDIIEWIYPASEKEYGEIRLVTKWNDDKPGGCYWKGGFRYESGDVVCDHSADGPKLRRENAAWWLDHQP